MPRGGSAGAGSNRLSPVSSLARTSSSSEQRPQALPRRDAQRGLDEVGAAAHLGGVLDQAADVALDHHDVFGRIGRGGGVVAAVAEPDLMHQHLGFRRHVAARSGEQQERAHRFAVGLGREGDARLRSPCRSPAEWSCRPWSRHRAGAACGRTRACRGPSRRQSPAPGRRRARHAPWQKSRTCGACSAVMAPTAEIHVRHLAPHTSAGPSCRHSKVIGRVRASSPWSTPRRMLGATQLASSIAPITTADHAVSPGPASRSRRRRPDQCRDVCCPKSGRMAFSLEAFVLVELCSVQAFHLIRRTT